MSDDQTPIEEPNPFESPRNGMRTSDSSRATAVRRVIVALVSVVLIPPAVIIAFFFGCLASGSPFDSMAIGCVGGTIAGLGVLVGMCYVANKLWKRS